MQNLNQTTIDFVRDLSLAKAHSVNLPPEETVKASEAASTLARIYESARNAVEFRADHLIRQAAITRILKRRLLLNQSSQKVASLLIKELIWARYLRQEAIPVSKIGKLASIIEKYRFAVDQGPKITIDKKQNRFTEWLLGLAACEIEESLVFNPLPQILINYVFLLLSRKFDFAESDAKIKNIQIYIATERAFAQNSEILISFRLLKTLLPEWVKGSSFSPELYTRLLATYEYILTQQNYPLKDALRRAVLKIVAPFNLVREMVYEHPEDFESVIRDPQKLEKAAEEILDARYAATKAKVNRASTRSIIYIFLTKMVLGLSLELPFDFFLGKTNYLALGINTIFPPLTMFLLNINVKLPDSKNTQRMIEKIKEYFYDKENLKPISVNYAAARRTIEDIFLAFYTLFFVGIFAGIVWVLRLFHFNPVSQIIFLFFLTVVSFFAYRVRSLTKDYMLPEGEKEGFISSLTDFIFLPIIRVGQWLSIQISYFNILSFIFDFIIEAPLKTFLEVFEEWIHFVRLKKEEIVS